MKFSHLDLQCSFQRVKDHLTKTLTLNMRSHILNCWSGLSQRLSKHIGYYDCAWLPSHPEVEGKNPLLKKPWTSDTGPRGHSMWADPNASSLRSSFYGTRRHHTEGNQPTSQQQGPECHNNSQYTVMACLALRYPRALFLDLRVTQQGINYALYWKPVKSWILE